MMDEIRKRAEADDRSVSSWIRRRSSTNSTDLPDVLPEDTEHLRFREMTEGDLDAMARLLGDAEVMRFYPRPKTREEAMDWIRWSRRNYSEYGHGLWIIESRHGDFIGDCGLTWQTVDELQLLEVGFHVIPGLQGNGFATEAAASCLDFARRSLDAASVAAIINVANTASRRVAEKLGMTIEQHTDIDGARFVVYGRPLV